SPAAACSSDADCRDGGPLRAFCHDGTCRVDQCLADSECATGQVCFCAPTRGTGLHFNYCQDSPCAVDAACGPGGVCSPSYAGGCGVLDAYYCHTAADTCQTDADCCVGNTQRCSYQPMLGHWACQAAIVCNG